MSMIKYIPLKKCFFGLSSEQSGITIKFKWYMCKLQMNTFLWIYPLVNIVFYEEVNTENCQLQPVPHRWAQLQGFLWDKFFTVIVEVAQLVLPALCYNKYLP